MGFRISQKGFTLLEMVVSIGIFSVVMIIAVGAVVAIENGQRKAQAFQSVQDNLRYTLEAMTKDIRVGSNFVLSNPVNGGNSTLQFQVSNTAATTYYYTYCVDGSAFAIDKFTSTSSSPICDSTFPSPITDASVSIDSLVFYLGPGGGQPRITILIKAHSGSGRTQTTYQLQTTVTARQRITS